MKPRPIPAYAVTKSTVVLYKLRPSAGFAWADIMIDANGHTGRISIASDYGDWQNYWGACGADFKTFLGQISEDYAASKFGAEEWISVNKTLKFYRELVRDYRRDTTLDVSEARVLMDEIKELEDESRETLVPAIQRTEKLESFLYRVCGMPELLREPNPHFAHFWKEIWPVLLAEFAREREAILA